MECRGVFEDALGHGGGEMEEGRRPGVFLWRDNLLSGSIPAPRLSPCPDATSWIKRTNTLVLVSVIWRSQD